MVGLSSGANKLEYCGQATSSIANNEALGTEKTAGHEIGIPASQLRARGSVRFPRKIYE
jgi:hypothetical protein